MMAGKILGVVILLGIFNLWTGVAGLTPPLPRFTCTKAETCRYIFTSDSTLIKSLCNYATPGTGRPDPFIPCFLQNKNRRDQEEIENRLFPYYYYGDPAVCPPLQRFNGGYWLCQDRLRPNAVTVYTSCEPVCVHGQLETDFYVRCNESRKWEHLKTPKCVDNSKPPATPPKNFAAPEINLTKISPSEIEASWEKNQDEDDVVKYILYLNDSSQIILTNFTCSKNECSHRFENLTAHTAYVVKLKAVSRTGYEQSSTEKRVVTSSYGFFKARNISCHSDQPDQITISWEPAPGSHRIVFGYNIYVAGPFAALSEHTAVSPLDTSFQIINLMESTLYSIVLETKFKNGKHLNSSVIQAVTQEFVPHELRNVSAQPFNCSAVLVNFSSPEQNFFQEFVMEYSIRINDRVNRINEFRFNSSKRRSDHSYLVGGLQPNTVYRVTVVALTWRREGELSDAVTVTTFKAPPVSQGTYSVLWVVLPIVSGLFVIVLVAFYCCHQRKNSKSNSPSDVSQSENICLRSRTDINSGKQAESNSLLRGGSISQATTINGGRRNTVQSDSGISDNTISTSDAVKNEIGKMSNSDSGNSSPASISRNSKNSLSQKNSTKMGIETSIKISEGGALRTDSDGLESKCVTCKLEGGTSRDCNGQESEIVDCSVNKLTLKAGGRNTVWAPHGDGQEVSTDSKNKTDRALLGGGAHEDSGGFGGEKSLSTSEENLKYADPKPDSKSMNYKTVDLSLNVNILNPNSIEEDYKKDAPSVDSVKIDLGPAPNLHDSMTKLNGDSLSHYRNVDLMEYTEWTKHQSSGEIQSSKSQKAVGDIGQQQYSERSTNKDESGNLPVYHKRMGNYDTREELPVMDGRRSRRNRGNLAELLDEAQCSVSIATAWDSTDFDNFFQELACKIDPDKHGEQKNWRGLLRHVLGYSHDKIEQIYHHTRGDPDYGHFIQSVKDLKAKGLYIGDILKYFAREKSLRVDVIELFRKYHKDCPLCERIYQQYLRTY